MSNPFLDPEPSGKDDEPTDSQKQNGGGPSAISLSKTNPFYEDLFGAPTGGHSGVESSNVDHSTLIDFASEGSDAKRESDGLDSADILLDVGGGGADSNTPHPVPQANGGASGGAAGKVNFEPQHFSIPPPMEFTDSLIGDISDIGAVSVQTTAESHPPVTNIDDLLGMDFSDTSESLLASAPAPATVAPTTTNGASEGSDDSFDFLLDAPNLDDIQEEEPPPVPTATFPGAVSEETSEETDAVEKTSVFLPSDNPADNITQVSVTSETSAVDSNIDNKTVYKTDISVTSPKTSVTEVNVTRPKPAPRAAGAGRGEESHPGPAVVTFDTGASPAGTQIQFDTSVSQPVTNITVPAGAFVLTTEGITKEPNSNPDEEEEITPMILRRDYQGKTLASPSLPETLGRQALGPRKLDESAKRDIQLVLAEMNKNTRGLPVVNNSVANGDVSDIAQEKEIVPVKLTRKEAETAELVLKNWVSGEKKAPTEPAKAPAKKSAFQKTVGTIIDVQTGKKELPANAVSFTTIGVTRTPIANQNGELEEEEEITPMTVHKDHLGNNHFAPSPPETLGKQAGLRKLDEAVKQDIAEVMMSMSEVPTQSAPSKLSQESDKDVKEESIVPTVLSREDANTALAVLSKWAKGESAPRSAPSSFQRLVTNVLDSKSGEGKPQPGVVNIVKDKDFASAAPVADGKTEDGENVSDPKEEEILKATKAMVNSEPAPKETEEQTKESDSLVEDEVHKPAKSPPEVKPKPAPPEVKLKPSLHDVKPNAGFSEKRSMFEAEKASPTSSEAKPLSSQKDSADEPTTKSIKPVPIQRGLRAPVKIGTGTLSQTSSISAKTFGKIGGLSVAGRPTSTLLSASKVAKQEFAKSRTDDAPFLVEVLKGIVGLGIKVVVTPEGYVQITEVQRTSPVDKNGNVKVGDYLVCVNTTELTGLTDGRVQQVLRLLPRGLVKLVVSTQPPGPTNDKGDAVSPVSPRPAGAYSQYGVRLSPRPFSPTLSSDDQPLSLTSPTTPPVADVGESQPTSVEPLSISVDSEEDSDMSTRKLTKALSPRSYAVQNYSPEPPKPAPRQRANVPMTLSTPPSGDGEHDSDQISHRKAERQMTANEIVAAASRRPSGRDNDLPANPDTSSPRLRNESFEEQSSPAASSPQSVFSIDPEVEASKHPSGVSSPRNEALPVFTETVKKVAPTPVPRHKPRTSSQEEMKDTPDGKVSAPELNHKEDQGVQAEGSSDVIQPQSVFLTHTSPPSTKIPPLVAPKPTCTSFIGSDKSASSSHSDDTAKDLPSPTMVSPRLRDFADASAPTVEEQQHSRKRVTSAARMFEKKAEESAKTMSTQTQLTKTSKSVSSVIRSFSREPDPEPAKQTVTMRKVSHGVSADSGRHVNSALLPPSERRKSMPNPTGTSSLSLTKPSSLSPLRTAPLSKSADSKKAEEAETERSCRINSALMPRHSVAGYPNTTSLKSISALRDSREDRQLASPPAVGKEGGDSKFSKFDTSVKSPTSPTSLHDSTSHHDKHAWSSSTSFDNGTDDLHTPKMIFTSSSLHNKDRHRPLSSSWTSEDSHDPHLKSTMKKFDDLLTDKHTLDSDDELPKVSNSVSLDLLKSRNAGKVAASMKSKEEEAAAQAVSAEEPSPKTQESSVEKLEETKEPKEEPEKVAAEEAHEEEKPEVSETVESRKVETVELAPPRVDQEEEVLSDTHHDEVPDHAPQKEVLEEMVETAVKKHETAPPAAQEAARESAAAALDKIRNAEPAPSAETEDAEEEEVAENKAEETGPDSREADAYAEAAELIYHQQASSIVDTVLSRAVMDVAILPPEDREEDVEEPSSPPPPPLPDEEPPPLPGAPPPPLILRNEAERLVDAADLVGMLPSQDADVKEVLESSDVEVDISETITAGSAQQSFSSPPQTTSHVEEAEEQTTDDDRGETEMQQVATSDVLISFDTAPSDSKPPVLTELPVSVDPLHREHDADLEKEDGEHSENPPVSDTLSQDSGVQDEDMSEDGLRFSQDDSPTSNVDSSVFDAAITPEDETVSVARAVSPPQVQVSSSPKCSSAPQGEEEYPGGVSTTGSEGRDSEVNVSKEDVDQKVEESDATAEEKSDTDSVQNEEDEEETSLSLNKVNAASLPADSTPTKDTPSSVSDVDRMPAIPEDSYAQDSADVVSSRKWCILDQSGSLFLHAEAKSTVLVAAPILRQVASVSPFELRAMIATGNEELDAAKASQSVELRVVGARGLDGIALEVDVFQREDYLVQVTKVLSKNSPVEEADLLLSVNGRSLKNRRPAQVHSQLDCTGPKDIVLTARGVKLPASLVIHSEASIKALSSPSSTTSQPAPPPPSSPAGDVAPTPAKSLGGGVYEVVMLKGATGVGFCLEGGKASPKGDLPILIKRIFKGGPAEKCGQLQVKDEILAVNDVEFTNMRHYEAWNHLKFIDDGEIRLKIRRSSDN